MAESEIVDADSYGMSKVLKFFLEGLREVEPWSPMGRKPPCLPPSYSDLDVGEKMEGYCELHNGGHLDDECSSARYLTCQIRITYGIVQGIVRVGV